MSPVPCPWCWKVNTIHSGTRPGGPQRPSGDRMSVSVCWGCHQLSIFVDGPLGLALRKPTPEETEAMAVDPVVQRALAAVMSAQYPDDAVAALRAVGEN